ncbi:MAG TPA: APC family permease [Gemmatimonadaceae bacterium]|nr:APC family permease [Gemmatimonadaceae bacterium]
MLDARFGITVVVGSTIGAGILRTPGSVAQLAGTSRLVLAVWILGGCYVLLAANCLSEIATMLPRAGGPYVYARRAFGQTGGFIVGATDWLLNTAAIAFLAVALAEYSARVLGSVAPRLAVISGAVLLLFALINGLGLRSSGIVQHGTTALKALAMLAFVVLCFVVGGTHAPATAPTTNAPVGTGSASSLLLAFQLVLGAYGGWNAAVYFAEEDRAPARNLPISLFGGILVIAVLYALINGTLLAVLPFHELGASTLPAADAIGRLVGREGSQVVAAFSILFLLSIINAGFLTTPRTLFALGRDGLLTRRLAAVSSSGVPAAALLVTALVAIVLAITGTFEGLLAFYASVGIVLNLTLTMALFVLRKREPLLHRPFRVRGYPYSAACMFAIDSSLLVLLTMQNPRNSWLLVLVALAGLAAVRASLVPCVVSA